MKSAQNPMQNATTASVSDDELVLLWLCPASSEKIMVRSTKPRKCNVTWRRGVPLTQALIPAALWQPCARFGGHQPGVSFSCGGFESSGPHHQRKATALDEPILKARKGTDRAPNQNLRCFIPSSLQPLPSMFLSYVVLLASLDVAEAIVKSAYAAI
jgi:hypothetical protein